MPIQFDDAAHHAGSLPSLRDRAHAIFEAIRSRVNTVDGNDSKAVLLQDLDDHRDALVNAIAGPDGGAARPSDSGRLGPNETPLMPGDRLVSHDDAERHSNPMAPRDASGHKIHSADAAVVQGRTDPKRAAGFGGSGTGVSADVRTQVARAAQDQPVAMSAQERAVSDRAITSGNGRVSGYDQAGTGSVAQGNNSTKVPVIHNEIVAGSERTDSSGRKLVTKRKQDGSTYEVIDNRPGNGPV